MAKKTFFAVRVQTRQVPGKFGRARWGSAIATQMAFMGIPWISWNGAQLLLFDIQARKFHIGAFVFGPESMAAFWLLAAAGFCSLLWASSIWGRFWCGFGCPQTIYSHLFGAVESLFEGERGARSALDRSPWGFEKAARKASKHFFWALAALAVGFSFVGYFTPIRGLAEGMLSGRIDNALVAWMAFYSVAAWTNAGFLREKVCNHLCPFPKMVQLASSSSTMGIRYDEARAEPRHAGKRKPGSSVGSCMDCTLCIQVCPMGIDFRNGENASCISCGACVDACSSAMERIGSGPGLAAFHFQRDGTFLKAASSIGSLALGSAAIALLIAAFAAC